MMSDSRRIQLYRLFRKLGKEMNELAELWEEDYLSEDKRWETREFYLERIKTLRALRNKIRCRIWMLSSSPVDENVHLVRTVRRIYQGLREDQVAA